MTWHQDSHAEDDKDQFLTLTIGCGVILLAVSAFGGLSYRFLLYTMDDAYITFRYALNFAAGEGLVFNPGEHPRAEGITSPLYAIVLSLAPLTGIDIVSFAKWLGICACALTSFLIGATIYTGTRSLTSLTRPSAIMAGCAGMAYFLTEPYVIGNAVSGMETALGATAFATFLLLVMRILTGNAQATPLVFVSLGVVAVLVPMLRPEMGLSVVVVLVAVSLLSREARRTMLFSLVVFVVLGALYFCLRFAYYGLPFPLPFYVKQSAFGLHGLSGMASYLAHATFLLPFVFVCFAFARGPNYADRKPVCVFLLVTFAAVAVQLAYYSTIHPIMGFGFRYFQPIAVGIIILAFLGSAILYEVASLSRLKSTFSLPLLFCIFIALSIGSNLRAYRTARALLIDWYAAGNVPETLEIAQTMKSVSLGTDFRIAMNDCGIIPFYTGFPTLDLGGLNNRAIALAGTCEAARNEITKIEPHLILLVTKERHNPYALHGWEKLSHEDLIALGYNYNGMMKEDRKMLNGDGYHLLVYAKEDPAVLAYLDRLAQIGVLKRGKVESRKADGAPEVGGQLR